MPGAGLCGRCVHARRIENDRGSVFLLCRLSREDERFPRYPRLPVWRCEGFRENAGTDREDPSGSGGDDRAADPDDEPT